MGSLFSTQPSITPHDRAVLDLKVQRDRLHKYTRQSAQIIENDTKTIKRLVRENKKDKALLVLKRRRHQENLLEKNQKLLDNIQEMVDSIQFAQMEVKVFQSLRAGANSLKQLHQQINLGELEDIMNDTAEGIAKQKEIDELLSGQLSEENEAEIEAELALLQQELAEASQVKQPTVVKPEEFPEVPVHEPTPDVSLPEVPSHALEEKEEQPLAA